MVGAIWISIAVLGIMTVLAAALAMVTIGADPKQKLNIFFGCFALAVTFFGTFGILVRYTLVYDLGDPRFYFELTIGAFNFAAPFLLLFTVRYLDLRTRWADLVASGYLIISVPALVGLFQHTMLTNVRLEHGYLLRYDVTPPGIAVMSANAAIMMLAFICYVIVWRRQNTQYDPWLATSTGLFAFSFVAAGIVRVPLPLIIVASMVSIVIMGYS